jgi:hypothetical protein
MKHTASDPAGSTNQLLVTVRPGALVWLVRAGQWLQSAACLTGQQMHLEVRAPGEAAAMLAGLLTAAG